MERTLGLRKALRTTAIVGLCFCPTMGVGSVWGILMDPPANGGMPTICLVVLIGVVWGGMSCLSIWLLLAYLRERLTITDDRIVQHGVTRTKAVSTDEIQILQWRAIGRQVRLRTPTFRMTISLDNFEPQDRLWLVRHLQRIVPEDRQEGWGKFCYEVAVPLRKLETRHLEPPDPKCLILTRKRWAWYFIPTTLVFTVVGIVLSWKFQLHRSLIAPVAPLLLWAFMHFSTPREGMPTPRINAQPGGGRYLLFLLVWGLIGMAATLVLTALKPPAPQAIAGVVSGGGIWFGILFYQAVQFARRQNQRRDEGIAAALKEWVENERDL